MAKKRVMFSPFLFFLLGLLLSALAGFFTGRFVSGMPNVEVRLNWWWKLSTFDFFIASLLVAEYILPAESLPISYSAIPPRSSIEFLRQISFVKQVFTVCVLMFPALAISTVIGDIPAILAASYVPAMIIVAFIACTWGTAVDLSPTLRKVGWKRSLMFPVIILLVLLMTLIFTISSPKIGNTIFETAIGRTIFTSLLAIPLFLYILEVTYRLVKKDLAEGRLMEDPKGEDTIKEV